MKFTKMHGAGNDYVYIDGFTEKMAQEDKPEWVRKVSDRHFGIGSDGAILSILPMWQILKWKCTTRTEPVLKCVETESVVWENLCMTKDLRIKNRLP